jgi:hypothetical protein
MPLLAAAAVQIQHHARKERICEWVGEELWKMIGAMLAGLVVL